MNLLLEIYRLRGGVGYVALAARLASPETRAETDRRVGEQLDSARALMESQEAYDALPVVRLPEFLPPHYPEPEVERRLSTSTRDYFGKKDRTRTKACSACRLPGHDVRTCPTAVAPESLPLHLVGGSRR